MPQINMIIDIPPRGKMRPRVSVVRGRPFMYVHKTQRNYEQSLQNAMAPFLPREPILGPVSLMVKAFIPTPKNFSLASELEAKNGHIRPTGKPDIDNLIKNIMDCMVRAGCLRDDNQVVELLHGTGKFYGDPPRWEIKIVW